VSASESKDCISAEIVKTSLYPVGKIMKVIQSILSEIKNIDETAGVLLTGSSVDKNIRSHRKDIDLIIISEVPRKVFLSYLRDGLGKFVEIIDGSIRLSLNRKEVGMVCFSESILGKKVEYLLNFRQMDLSYKTWAIGAEFPEGFLGDLLNSVILSDSPNLYGVKVKQKIREKRKELFEKLCTKTLNDLTTRLTQINKALLEGDSLSYQILLSDILVLLVRLSYVEEESFCCGVKHFEYKIPRKHFVPRIIQDILSKPKTAVIKTKEVLQYYG
jgi:hypothetical protein